MLQNLQVLQLATPSLLVGFALFSHFVAKRLPSMARSGWRLFTIGGYVAIAGLGFASFLGLVEIGAGMILLGWIVCAVGLVNVLSARQ